MQHLSGPWTSAHTALQGLLTSYRHSQGNADCAVASGISSCGRTRRAARPAPAPPPRPDSDSSFSFLPDAASRTAEHSRDTILASVSDALCWDSVAWIAHSLAAAVDSVRIFLQASIAATAAATALDYTAALEDMATAVTKDTGGDQREPVLGEDGKPLSPRMSERYNEDVVAFTDKDGKEVVAVVTVSRPPLAPESPVRS